jgi:hypothetical protein
MVLQLADNLSASKAAGSRSNPPAGHWPVGQPGGRFRLWLARASRELATVPGKKKPERGAKPLGLKRRQWGFRPT